MMNFEYLFDQKRSITNEEWALIKENLILAFELFGMNHGTSIFKAHSGDEDEAMHYWTSLFSIHPPSETRDIAGWDIEGQCLAFGGGSRQSFQKKS